MNAHNFGHPVHGRVVVLADADFDETTFGDPIEKGHVNEPL